MNIELYISGNLIESMPVVMDDCLCYEDRRMRAFMAYEWFCYKYGATMLLLNNWEIVMTAESRMNPVQKERDKKVNGMNILYLTLKAEYYDMIAAGIKLEEYREIKPFWSKRLVDGNPARFHINGKTKFKEFNAVRFARGGHFHPTVPQMTIELKRIIVKKGNPIWGAEPGKKYFTLELGRKLLDLPIKN